MLSSSFLKGIRAIIDTEHGSLWGKLLNRELLLELAAKNLLMMDLNHLWCGKSWEQPAPKSSPCGLISQSEDVEKLLPADLMQREEHEEHTSQVPSHLTQHVHDHDMSQPEKSNAPSKGFQHP